MRFEDRLDGIMRAEKPEFNESQEEFDNVTM